MVKNAPRLAEWTMGVGGQFGHDEDRIIGGRAARQVPGHRLAYAVNLIWTAWVGGYLVGAYGWFCPHAGSGLRHGEAVGAGGAATVFADRLLQVRLER